MNKPTCCEVLDEMLAADLIHCFCTSTRHKRDCYRLKAEQAVKREQAYVKPKEKRG